MQKTIFNFLLSDMDLTTGTDGILTTEQKYDPTSIAVLVAGVVTVGGIAIYLFKSHNNKSINEPKALLSGFKRRKPSRLRKLELG